MATIAGDSYPLEFNFIENPIIVGVTNFEFQPNSSFRQAVIEVEVTPTYSGASVSKYRFYTDATAGIPIRMDISTALRGAMCEWQPDISAYTSKDAIYSYPYATFTVRVYEKYLLDGTVYEDLGAERTGAYAYYGGLTEYERLIFEKHAADIFVDENNPSQVWTRKPNSKSNGEIIETGFYRSYYSFNYTNRRFQTRIYQTTSENEGKENQDAGGYFWQLPVSGERRQFAFVNSLGVIETIMAQSRESLSYDIESNTKSLVSTPQYKPNPNITTHKTGGRNKWQMSSGKVNREWADWWVTEFLMAKKYWMLHSGMWLPVVVTPADDSMEIYNRSENNLPHVDFDVQLAVKGSITNLIKN